MTRASSSRTRADDLGLRAGLRGSGRRPADAPRLPRPCRRHRLRPRARPAPRADPARAQGGPPPSHPGHRLQHVADLRPPLRRCLERPRPGAPGRALCEVTDPDGTVHRAWPIADPEVHDAVAAVVAGSELLIADGHHRYETARTYADEVGAGAGEDARYTLACLVSLEDPGLSVFATHRLLHDLDEAKRLALRDTLTELFDLEPIDDPADLVPDAGGGTIAYGYMDSFHRKPFRLRLKDDAVLAAALPDASRAYRTLDAAALEALILTGPLAMSTDDIAAKRGLSYCSDFGEAVARVERGDADAGFFLRPTPVQQVRDVADAGETMPPKSTYFFPKLLTGIVFNPLSRGKDG